MQTFLFLVINAKQSLSIAIFQAGLRVLAKHKSFSLFEMSYDAYVLGWANKISHNLVGRSFMMELITIYRSLYLLIFINYSHLIRTVSYTAKKQAGSDGGCA